MVILQPSKSSSVVCRQHYRVVNIGDAILVEISLIDITKGSEENL
jgi:hypothetical protein